MTFKNWVPTVAGLFAAVGSVPAALATLDYHLNRPLSFGMAIAGLLGVAMLGRSAKGEDQHSTPAQVAASGAAVVATTLVAVKAAEVQVKIADEAAKKNEAM